MSMHQDYQTPPERTSYEQLLRILTNRTVPHDNISQQVYYFGLLDELRILDAQQKRRAENDRRDKRAQ
jgi:hypothetical protein